MTGNLYCMRTTYAPGVPALERFCTVCAWPVWVSRTMVGRVDSGEMEAVCNVCGRHVLETTERPIAELHPDQLGELAQLGILGFSRQFVANMNRGMPWPWR